VASVPYDPDFIPGQTIPLPAPSPRVVQECFAGGAPVDHTHFSLIFNQVRGFAHTVAHNIDGADTVHVKRSNRFRFDTDIPNDLQVDNERGYKGDLEPEDNPWDRGHLARRVSLLWGDPDEAFQAEHESFFYSNIAPQHGGLHDNPWGAIEDFMLELADENNLRACVFTGPVFTAEDPEIENMPGELPIRIPAGFWKIMAIQAAEELQAAGFLVWQRDFDGSVPLAFDPILEQVRITTIEYLTGLSFGQLREADPLRFGEESAADAPAIEGAVAAAPAAPRPVARLGVSPRPSRIISANDIVMRTRD
jgi:endonuclease G